MKGQKRTPVPSSVPREVGPSGPVSAYGNSDAQADMTATSNADECDLLGLSSTPSTDAGASGAPATPGGEGWSADPDDAPWTGGLPSGLLSRAEAATGADLGDVRLHVDGDAAAEGAAAFAEGRDIHLNPVTLGADGEPNDELVAHELVHVLQQDSSDTSSGAGSLEREADDGAGAILQGRELAVEGGTGGP